MITYKKFKQITPPEWKVCFGAGFFETKGYGRAGKVMQIDKHFAWGGSDWYIPAVYICSGGVVMDICVEAIAEMTISGKKETVVDIAASPITGPENENIETTKSQSSPISTK